MSTTTRLPDDAPCACGSGSARQACCGPYLAGSSKPATAEALMRSRYTAFVEGQVDYIRDTLHPEALKDHDEQATRTWSQNSEWHGLEVVSTRGGGETDEQGEVEFIARYSQKGKRVNHHERGLFAKHEGRWVFVDSAAPAKGTITREGPKVGRNDPCACGSGKKAKKCCAA